MDAERAYSVLGVAPGCTPREVQLAYRRKAMEVHPDKASSEDETRYFTRRFMELRDAYELLRREGFPVPEPQSVVADPPAMRTASRSFVPREDQEADVPLSEKLGLGFRVENETILIWGILIPAGALGLIWFLRYLASAIRPGT